MLVCALGDVTLDVIVRVEDALSDGADTSARIALSPGGQAANVAAWAVALGANARVIAKTGSDDEGAIARSRLRELGVEIAGPVEGRTAVVCSFVSSAGERTMASDRGSAADLRPEEIEVELLDGCTHLHVSGYALAAVPARTAAVRAAELARALGAAISVDLPPWTIVAACGAKAFRAAVEEIDPDAVFASEDEERIVGGPIPGAAWILKRGDRGCSFAGDDRGASSVVDVVDTTGAGDALAAGWIVGGPDVALRAAALCVERMGAMPPPRIAT